MLVKYIKKIVVFVFLILILSTFLIPKSYADEEKTPNIISPSALLMDLKSGKILFEKNINKKMYPASLTKVLTAIIVLENCDLNETATVSNNAVSSISFGYVTANLQVGEELTVEQLLNVLMIGSSNDAAVVLAEHVSGSVEKFAKLMNEKAKELGCTSSNFVNPNGAHDESHYSSAHDLALIARYAMQNETFKEIVSTTTYKLPITNKYKRDDRLFSTTNSLLQPYNTYYYRYATGIKTGFTTPAGNCLIASAKKDDLELLTVILGANQNEQGVSQRYVDTRSLFDYGYNTYSLREVIKAGNVVQTTKVKNATNDTKNLDAVAQNDIYALTKISNEDDALLPTVNLNDNIKAPIKQGDVIGTVTYTIEGVEYTENLIAKNDVEKSNLPILILIAIFIIVFICVYLKAKNIKKKNRRLRFRKRITRYK